MISTNTNWFSVVYSSLFYTGILMLLITMIFSITQSVGPLYN